MPELLRNPGEFVGVHTAAIVRASRSAKVLDVVTTSGRHGERSA